MKNTKNGLGHIIVQFCVAMTIIWLIWVFSFSLINQENPLLGGLIILITGIGGVGIYIIIGTRLRDIWENKQK